MNEQRGNEKEQMGISQLIDDPVELHSDLYRVKQRGCTYRCLLLRGSKEHEKGISQEQDEHASTHTFLGGSSSVELILAPSASDL